MDEHGQRLTIGEWAEEQIFTGVFLFNGGVSPPFLLFLVFIAGEDDLANLGLQWSPLSESAPVVRPNG